METHPAPAHPQTLAGMPWATVIGIVVTVLTAALVVAGMALAKFEDGLTQHGYLKDHAGSALELLRPGGMSPDTGVGTSPGTAPIVVRAGKAGDYATPGPGSLPA
ncbi:hypothetical protein ABTZ03_09525 [Kitasatospora sp. NPDC096077]|uniref:hypothetical protein n=1 Tax=Kitasatospora sp. NPDC096077 TaxID=3155544 RepID=UPI0033199469